jgi:hypothetical protein
LKDSLDEENIMVPDTLIIADIRALASSFVTSASLVISLLTFAEKDISIHSICLRQNRHISSIIA